MKTIAFHTYPTVRVEAPAIAASPHRRRWARAMLPCAVLMRGKAWSFVEVGSDLACLRCETPEHWILSSTDARSNDWWFDEDEPVETIRLGCWCWSAIDIRTMPHRVLRRVPAREATDYFTHAWPQEAA